jgi:hypothetical protein
MISNTKALIENLSRNIEPVRPMRRPVVSTVLWVGLLLPYAVLAILLIRTVTGRPWPAMNVRFFLEQFFALSTGIVAALAAFASVIPGRSRHFAAWILLPMTGWMLTLGEGCLHAGSGNLTLQHSLLCFPYIAILGSAPAVILWAMLRRGAPLTPHLTMACLALAAAGIGNFCVRLVHPEDVSLMLLVWHLGGISLLVALTSAAGRRFLNWRSVMAAAPPTER